MVLFIRLCNISSYMRGKRHDSCDCHYYTRVYLVCRTWKRFELAWMIILIHCYQCFMMLHWFFKWTKALYKFECVGGLKKLSEIWIHVILTFPGFPTISWNACNLEPNIKCNQCPPAEYVRILENIKILRAEFLCIHKLVDNLGISARCRFCGFGKHSNKACKA